MTIVPNMVKLLRGSSGPRIRCAGAVRQSNRAHLWLAALLAVTGVTRPALAGWVGQAIDLMGTRVSVELWSDDEDRGHQLVEQVLAEYRRIDHAMSTYKPDSEISFVNDHAAMQAVPIDAELYGLITRALDLSKLSHGAFDITYESVGYMYDFHAHQHPSDAEIGAHLPAIDYHHVVLEPKRRTIRFTVPGVRINLGGIAKGYTVEHAAAMLRQAGIQNALLNAGGDTRVIGDRRGKPWIVGIRHPRLADQVFTRIPVVDEAISTSGDYERFFEEDGHRYHHIMNPATGKPTEGILSVTVIGPDATMTDGLSTTLFVLGAEKGIDLIETLDGYEAVIVDSKGKLTYSSGLAPPAQ